MEHEVFVPVEVERLREVLDDPARVARAVPGLQHDAGAPDPVAGRLKIRVGGHSVTYRGALRVSGRDDGSYAVEGDAAETRGTGSVKLALRLRLREAEGGTVLTVDGTATADGRITDLPADAVASAVSRLWDRFAGNLGTVAADRGTDAPDGAAPEPAGAAPGPESPELLAAGDFEPRATDDFETTPDADDAPPPAPRPAEPAEPAEEPAPDLPSVFGTEVPPPAPGPAAGEEGDSVAEAAHARRTMIGRSAEEVDHAPPRGRYAPVPAPQTVSPRSPLRWAAPAAAFAVASAVVVVRALRRRH
ncbi:SRPBCC domain-containing protein [Streptomyces sp. Tu 3180]|uniref:SRPBCC domain-containing protein n=1 Tax=Streptomyces sp. Tu 3180 TaxID=2682611 RepID=UPI00135C340D|nr:SRPBCC domain-containing protein [Streptomyces sp. Tu 3180]KAF3466559.1 carbon monoxide dehydrogenase [Streptomyces sp. Tu 3180]